VIIKITIRNTDVINKSQDIYCTEYRLLKLELNFIVIFILLGRVSSTLSSYGTMVLWLHIQKCGSFPCIKDHIIAKPLLQKTRNNTKK
jgi:hypothetical protein